MYIHLVYGYILGDSIRNLLFCRKLEYNDQTTHMKKFFPLTLVVIGLLFLAWICYKESYVDPTVTDKQVTAIVDKLDGLYKNRDPSSSEKRNVVFEDMFHEHKADFRHTLLGHLSIAFFVAALLILTVDSITRSMTNREFKEHANSVSQNVWNAIFKRLVPSPIAVEVERLLRSQVCRIRPHYTVTFPHNAYIGIPHGYVVVRRQLFYRLRNLTGAPVSYNVTVTVISHTPDHTLKTHVGQHDKILPAICKLSVDKKEVAITNRINLSHTITLPRMMTDHETIEVFSEVEEMLEVSDRAIYVLKEPCFDLELTVINQNQDQIEVKTDQVLITSGAERLRETTPGTWFAEGGVLPGTALLVPWNPSKAQVGQGHPLVNADDS